MGNLFPLHIHKQSHHGNGYICHHKQRESKQIQHFFMPRRIYSLPLGHQGYGPIVRNMVYTL